MAGIGVQGYFRDHGKCYRGAPVKKLVLLTLIFAAGLIYYIKTDLGSMSGHMPTLPSLPTAEIVRGTLSSVISGRGKIVPNRLVPVNSFIEGQINEIVVKQGEEVQKGQCLVKLDVEPGLKFRILELKQKVITNDFNKRQLKKKIDLQNNLYKEGLSSLSEIEELKKKVKWAEMEREALNYERQLLEKQFGFSLTMSSLLHDDLSAISNSCVQSPMNGIVLQINKKVDDVVFRDGGFGRATIMVIADISEYFVDYKVSELDIDKIHEGQRVDITLDSMPDISFRGKVESIASLASYEMRGNSFSDPSRELTRYSVKIRIIDTTPALRPDLSCGISIKIATRPDVLLAPVTSIFTDENGQRSVFVQKDAEYERRKVQVGIMDINMVEIQTGLAEGEVVCLEPLKIIEHRKIITAAESRTFIEKILH
jgi:RND family efflux transporter MFP subunit